MIVGSDSAPKIIRATAAESPPAVATRTRGPSPVGPSPAWRRAGWAGRSATHTRILVVTLVGVAVAGRLLSPTFFSLPNLENIMLNVSILGMLALGVTLVMLLREIDLSVGSLMAFAPVVAVSLTDKVHQAFGSPVIKGANIVEGGTALLIVFTLVVSALVGVINGFITVKGPVPSVIVTLGMLFALRGGAYVVSGGNQYYLTDLPRFMWLGSATVFDFVPVSFVIFVAIGTLGVVSLRFTKAGRRIYSIGGNEKAAVYAGVNAGRWKILAFVCCGLCAGVAALFFSSRLGSAEPAQASGLELSAIAIAVIGGVTLEGGRGTLLNTMLSSLLLAVVLNIIALRGLVVWYQTIIIGGIIIAAGFAYTVKDRGANAP
jgi:ribose/xylose/arabinose/galactoside ABC-type transport system permease subunit